MCQVEPGGIWAISRFADVEYAYKHPEIFSSAGVRALFEPEWIAHNPIAHSLLTADPPEHGPLRALVNRGFTARSMARLEPRIRELANGLVARFSDRQEGDFVSAVCQPLPAQVICEVAGLDDVPYESLNRWVEDLASIAPVRPSDERVAALQNSLDEMARLFGEAVEKRRTEPQDDILSALLGANIEGRSLDDEELMAFMFALVPAGFETTRHLLANTMLTFARSPESYKHLRAHPEEIPAYIEEVLRYEPPVHGIFRLTTQEVTLRNTTIPAHALVLLLMGAANRDPERFAKPDVFDPSRTERHIGFGHGIHFCIGAPLARMEAVAVVEALLERFERFACMSPPQWCVSPIVRGPTTLPIRGIPV